MILEIEIISFIDGFGLWIGLSTHLAFCVAAYLLVTCISLPVAPKLQEVDVWAACLQGLFAPLVGQVSVD